jgi:uncharacterized protein (UPF0264 family)
MEDLERELGVDLRRVMARREPSADFAERVLAQLPAQVPEQLLSSAKVVAMPQQRTRRLWNPAAVGALAAGLAAMTFGLYQYQEYQRGVEAKRQLMTALEITAQKLHVAQDRLHQKNVNQRNQRP